MVFCVKVVMHKLLLKNFLRFGAGFHAQVKKVNFKGRFVKLSKKLLINCKFF